MKTVFHTANLQYANLDDNYFCLVKESIMQKL